MTTAAVVNCAMMFLSGACVEIISFEAFNYFLFFGQELITEYKGKGERSIADSAALVGLRLPKQPPSNET